jgi:hypothetical protein
MRFSEGLERRAALVTEMEFIIDCLEELRSDGVPELLTLRATLSLNFEQLVSEIHKIDSRMRSCREGQRSYLHCSAATDAKRPRCFANRKAARW